jgi:plastocyanin
MRLSALVSGFMVYFLMIGPGHAEEFMISQKKKRFTPKEVVAKVGDSIRFINDDRYAHNLFSESAGMELDVRKQMPGDTYTVKLNKRGKFEVRCVIHPRMKMTIQVK